MHTGDTRDELAGRFALERLLKESNGVATYAGTDLSDGAPVIVKTVVASEVSTAVRLRLEHETLVLESLAGEAFRPLLASGHDGSLSTSSSPASRGRR